MMFMPSLDTGGVTQQGAVLPRQSHGNVSVKIPEGMNVSNIRPREKVGEPVQH